MDGWNGEDQLKTFYIIQSTVELFHWKWIFDIFDEKLSLHLQTTYICAKFFYHNIFWSTNCAMCTNILQVKMRVACTFVCTAIFSDQIQSWTNHFLVTFAMPVGQGKHILCGNILFVPHVFSLIYGATCTIVLTFVTHENAHSWLHLHSYIVKTYKQTHTFFPWLYFDYVFIHFAH